MKHDFSNTSVVMCDIFPKGFTHEVSQKMNFLNGPGIYAFYSPSKNLAYVGKADNIFNRLKQHIKEAFIAENFKNTTSHKVLILEDVQMYCCYTRDVYNYVDVKDELKALEFKVIKAFDNTGINLTNICVDYDTSRISGIVLSDTNDLVELEGNMFKFGLKEHLVASCHNNRKKKTNEYDEMLNRISILEDDLAYERKRNRILQQKNTKYRVDYYHRTLSKYEKEIEDLETKLYQYEKGMYNNEFVNMSDKYKNKIKTSIKKLCTGSVMEDKDICDDTDVALFTRAFKETEYFNFIVDYCKSLSDIVDVTGNVHYSFYIEIQMYLQRRTSIYLLYFNKYKMYLSEEKREKILKDMFHEIAQLHKGLIKKISSIIEMSRKCIIE